VLDAPRVLASQQRLEVLDRADNCQLAPMQRDSPMPGTCKRRTPRPLEFHPSQTVGQCGSANVDYRACQHCAASTEFHGTTPASEPRGSTVI
jgi:hypothetical protein